MALMMKVDLYHAEMTPYEDDVIMIHDGIYDGGPNGLTPRA
jgi:hypothetical protein